MARNESITNTIWDDLDDLSADAMLLYIWTWTNPRCGMAGLYRVPRRALAEGRLDDARLDAALAELTDAGHVRYERGVLWCCGRVRRLVTRTQQVARAVAKDLDLIDEDHPLRVAFLTRYRDVPWLRAQLQGSGVPEPVWLSQANKSDPPDPPDRHDGQDLSLSESESVVCSAEGITAEQQTVDARARQRSRPAKPDRLPDGLDAALVAAAGELMPRLRSVWQERGGDEPTWRGLGLALRRFPDRDHAAVMSELEHWALAGRGARKPVKDWCRTLATFLDHAQRGTPPRLRAVSSSVAAGDKVLARLLRGDAA